MSYDLRIAVKIEGYDGYADIAEPELASPTYNLGTMFRTSTGWDFEQSVYYKAKDVLPMIEHGISELRLKPTKYKKFEPGNGWGTIGSAVNALESLRACIYETAERIPIEHLWVCW